MNRHRWTFCVVAVLFLGIAAAAAEPSFRVLPDTLNDGPPGDMMKRYLLKKVDACAAQWREDYEHRTSSEAIAEYQQRMRDKLVAALGGFPERTPLNAQVVGMVQRKGYRVEKILFESQPRFYVAAALFVPDSDRFKPPYPGVLIPCGHSAKGKAHPEYQTMAASLAYHGMAALVFDPIDQGERAQWLDDQGKPPIWGCLAHSMVGEGCMLVGQNTARFEIWDGMRALDYLVSRPEVDPNRIGCTGNSGGGTQTAYLMALDDRIKAAAPSCFLHTMAYQLQDATGDAEQNTFGQLAFGLDHADFMMMRAPMPIKMLAATHDFFKIEGAWECFRYAKRLYSRMGYSERVDLLENDERHNYNKLQREAALRWLARWLQGRDEALQEPDIEIVPVEELNCAPRGQVLHVPGARSAYDLNIDTEKALARQRAKLWASTERGDLLAKVRVLAGIRPLEQLPEPKVETKDSMSLPGCTVEKLLLSPENGIVLPALLFCPAVAAKRPVLFLHEKGVQAEAMEGGVIRSLVAEGHPVMAVEVRGTGETEQTTQTADNFGPHIGFDWEDNYKAYVLGLTYVGMRAEDVLVSARYLQERLKSPSVELAATGSVGVPALHAAALEPGLFSRVRLEHSLISWADVVEKKRSKQQLANIVNGALTVYDVPDLRRVIGRKLVMVRPVDAQGEEICAAPGCQ